VFLLSDGDARDDLHGTFQLVVRKTRRCVVIGGAYARGFTYPTINHIFQLY